jgi:pimeloyl-ACP methyl ester carboxylesterase
MRLHYAKAGRGPLMVFLHGFPEFWYAWRKQIEPFAAAGFRVLAPDLRGYNLSDKPTDVSSYDIDELVLDVAGLIAEAGREKAFVVGHDWGGAVAWRLGMTHPERIERLGLLNVPHPSVMRYHLRHSPAQRRRSWYMFYFQLPQLPEATFRLGNFRFIARALRNASRPGTFSDDDLARYRQAWSQPGAVRSMIHWYRAAPRVRLRSLPNRRLTVPTLLLWGTQDRFLGRELAQPSIERCDEGRLVFLEEAGHFVQHEEPERVNGILADFFS